MIVKNIFLYAIYVIDRLLMSWTSRTLYSFQQWLNDKHNLGLKENSFIRVTAFLIAYFSIKYLDWLITLSIFITTLIIFILLVVKFRK